MKDKVKSFDALKARKVLERVNNFLGALIRDNLVKDVPFLNEVEIENESDLADDVWEVLQGVLRNCDVGTAEEQNNRFKRFCDNKSIGYCWGRGCRKCMTQWLQMSYKEEPTNEHK